MRFSDATKIAVTLHVNGRPVAAEVEPRVTLAAFLRDHLDLTGLHVGCGHGVCGACAVLMDGLTARACTLLAVAAQGARIETIEGLSDRGALRALQRTFAEHGALQCGFCTPGMLLAAHELLAETPAPSPAQIREALSGVICRCTGYGPIVDAVAAAASESPPAEPRPDGLPSADAPPSDAPPSQTPPDEGAPS